MYLYTTQIVSLKTFFFMITCILWDPDENFLFVSFVNRKNVFDQGVQNVQETCRPWLSSANPLVQNKFFISLEPARL
jgi:hypothetical protein